MLEFVEELVNSLMLPVLLVPCKLATRISPRPSIAIPCGWWMPPPVNPAARRQYSSVASRIP